MTTTLPAGTEPGPPELDGDRTHAAATEVGATASPAAVASTADATATHLPVSRAELKAARRATRAERAHTGLYLILGIALWLALGLVVVVGLQDRIVLAGWSFLGAFLVPSALVYAMAGRLRPSDSITPSDLARFMLLGGFLAFCIGGTVDATIGHFAPGPNPSTPSMVSFALSGVVEEFAKLVIVLVLARRTVKTVRNGLFLGGAVGAGFAAFETLGYVIEIPIKMGAVADGGFVKWDAFVAFDRALTSPLGHPLWAALLAAAVFAAASRHGGRYRITFGVVGAYLGVAVLHGLNDVALTLGTSMISNTLLQVVVSWMIVIVIAVPGVLVWHRLAKRTAPVSVDPHLPSR